MKLYTVYKKIGESLRAVGDISSIDELYTESKNST